MHATYFRFVIFMYTTMLQRTEIIATLTLLATVMDQGIVFLFKRNKITFWEQLNNRDLKIHRNCYNYNIHVASLYFFPQYLEYTFLNCIEENCTIKNYAKNALLLCKDLSLYAFEFQTYK